MALDVEGDVGMVKLVEKIRTELKKHEIKLLDIYRFNSPKGSGKAYDVFRVLYGDKIFLIKFNTIKEALSLEKIVDRIVKETGAR
ncbi:MAG: hypothetical protein DRO23_05955 [Thermoprotei archaeon]|nr:MAG: hypothetical protein DRO23_05955 [Thermoprotei archaeon]